MDDRLAVVEQVITCTSCELHRTCTMPVPMRGPKAKVAIVGEAPGEQEDLQGRPFVGPAGKLLSGLLAEVGLVDDYAFINTVSCFPNGTPTWDHVDACEANKLAQLEWVNPDYVLLLGRIALKGMRRVLDLKARGRPFKAEGTDAWCFATYHPAAALRNHRFEEAMRADLTAFRQMVEWDDPMRFLPDNCAACTNFAEWWEDESALGWCPQHIPESQQPAYKANRQRVDDEIARVYEARTASDVWQSEMARNRGVARADAGADPDWKAATWASLVEYLKHHSEFFVDDFWADAHVVPPRESRALGPLVLRAAREGLMEKTDTFRKSIRSNMTEKPVWRSLVFERAS